MRLMTRNPGTIQKIEKLSQIKRGASFLIFSKRSGLKMFILLVAL